MTEPIRLLQTTKYFSKLHDLETLSAKSLLSSFNVEQLSTFEYKFEPLF